MCYELCDLNTRYYDYLLVLKLYKEYCFNVNIVKVHEQMQEQMHEEWSLSKDRECDMLILLYFQVRKKSYDHANIIYDWWTYEKHVYTMHNVE